MKSPLYAICWALVAVVASGLVLSAQEPVPVTVVSVFAWDHSGKDVQGAPENVAYAHVAYSSPEADLRLGAPPLFPPVLVRSNGAGSLSAAELFSSAADGQYRVWVRVRDEAGNWSQWSDPLDVVYQAPIGTTLLRGDANSDGRSNIADAIWILDFLFRGNRTLKCWDAADSNDNGTVNISDAIHFLYWLFWGGPAPPSPGPYDCGIDPTPDGLPACDHPSC